MPEEESRFHSIYVSIEGEGDGDGERLLVDCSPLLDTCGKYTFSILHTWMEASTGPTAPGWSSLCWVNTHFEGASTFSYYFNT